LLTNYLKEYSGFDMAHTIGDRTILTEFKTARLKESHDDYLDAIGLTVDKIHKEMHVDGTLSGRISSAQANRMVHLDFTSAEERVKAYLEADQENHIEDKRGQLWNKEDEKQLMYYHSVGKAIHNVAKRLGRTECAIEARLVKLGLIESTHSTRRFVKNY
jgi:hypothetical protein